MLQAFAKPTGARAACLVRFRPTDRMPVELKHSRVLTATLLLVGLVMAGGCAKKRIKGEVSAPRQTLGEAAKNAQAEAAKIVLPPSTMTPREIRLALWDIASRQRRGEGGKVLADYADRSASSRTLEARFLAAAAIPDLEAQWDALYLIAKDQPKFFWAHAQMAAIYAAWKVRDQCARELALAEQLLPGVAYTATIRGHLYRNAGELLPAVREYQNALRIDPADADARTGAALAKRALQSVDTLESELKRSLSDVPTLYDAAEALATYYDEQDRPQDAQGAWTRVAELMPKNRSARLALARLAGDQDPSSAITAYEEAAKIQALTKGEQQSLARLYQKVGRTDDEIKALQQLTKLDPKDAAPLRRLAAIYEGRKDLPNTEAQYNALRALDGKDTQALVGLARVAEKRMMLRSANELYKEAAAAGEAKAEGDVKRLRDAFLMPAKPLAGKDLTTFYRNSLDSLEVMYVERLKVAPALKGSLRAKIVLDGEGKATSVDVVENTTSDPYLDAHLYYTLLEGAWPKLKANERKSFTLKFDLPPEKN